MTSDSIPISVDPRVEPIVESVRSRRLRCPSCAGEKTVNNRNSEGHWYCRCLSCGCRFWHSDTDDD